MSAACTVAPWLCCIEFPFPVTRPDPASPAALMPRTEVNVRRAGWERGFPEPHGKVERVMSLVSENVCASVKLINEPNFFFAR